MYTEDDEKVEVKKESSNIKESDFYTSFNDIEKDDKKEKKSKKVKESKKEEVVVQEDDYQDFYNGNNDEVVEEDNGKKNIRKLIIAGAILLLMLIILVIILIINANKVDGDIIIDKSDITLKVGEKEYISYQIVDTENEVVSNFSSSNETVATVSEFGEVTAVNTGNAVITVRYTISGVTREKECNITVNSKSGSNTTNNNNKLTLNLKLENGKNNAWTNKDVTITPEVSGPNGIDSIKYAINCSKDCTYKDITNSKIKISSSGVAKVKVIAKDKKNQEVTKEVTIKIDKEAPKVTLNSDTSISSTKDVEVCATCTDSLSGCKQGKVCKKYTASASNQTITVEDNAGNKSTTKAFNVKITKIGSLCTLRVSTDGTVTATLREESSYYGFNSSYSGSNETSKKISISASKNGESGAKVVYYYVKTNSGIKGKCFITVIKRCTCANNSNDPNCSVSCTFTSQ